MPRSKQTREPEEQKRNSVERSTPTRDQQPDEVPERSEDVENPEWWKSDGGQGELH